MSDPPQSEGRGLDDMRRVCGVERPERHLEPLATFEYVSARFGSDFWVFRAHFDLV